MRWYISYPILAAGLAFGFHTVFPDRPEGLRASDITTSSIDRAAPDVVLAQDLEPAPPSRLAAFSPGAVLIMAELKEGRSSVLHYLAETLAPLDLTPVAATEPAAAATPVTVAAWTSAVISNETVTAAGAKPSARQVPLSRVALARDIQTELARVGCYVGDIDGVWGTGSKRAASVFMDRVNAALPTAEPDVFLLSLLRTENDEVCGATCPQGQSLTANGRCVPATLLAQADKSRGSAPDRTVTVTASIDDDPVAPRPVPAVRPVPVAHPDPVTVAAARAPLPFGRMSIGGPRPDEAATPVEAPASMGAATDGATRTAAITETDGAQGEALVEPEDMPRVVETSFDTTVAPAAPSRKAKGSGSRKSARNGGSGGGGQRYSSYRHVQRLFENPLGRM